MITLTKKEEQRVEDALYRRNDSMRKEHQPGCQEYQLTSSKFNYTF